MDIFENLMVAKIVNSTNKVLTINAGESYVINSYRTRGPIIINGGTLNISPHATAKDTTMNSRIY